MGNRRFGWAEHQQPPPAGRTDLSCVRWGRQLWWARSAAASSRSWACCLASGTSPGQPHPLVLSPLSRLPGGAAVCPWCHALGASLAPCSPPVAEQPTCCWEKALGRGQESVARSKSLGLVWGARHRALGRRVRPFCCQLPPLRVLPVPAARRTRSLPLGSGRTPDVGHQVAGGSRWSGFQGPSPHVRACLLPGLWALAECVGDRARHALPCSPLGCMICLGQSTFLRFNHPAEAKWMKSMIPAGGRSPGATYGRAAGR